MECNKDEAVRAKEIAEKKLLEKDIAGAKKFAVKAQNLYPGLEGISQMMATLNVYVAAENKVNGEGNWYEILGVNPLADEETIRKQFRKLALMFHPDKNKTVGAEGAFKHISEAWSLLSDKSKRLAYDQRNASVFHNGGTNAGPSPPPMQSGFHDLAKSKASRMRVPKGNTNTVGSSSAPSSSRKQEKCTFWTVCHRCKMQYEYLRMYLNQNLLCPNCREAFFAVEIATPSSNSYKKSSESNYSHQQQNLHQHGMRKKTPNTGKRDSSTPNGGSSNDSSNCNDFHWVPFSRTTAAASAAQAAGMVQRAYEKVKRERQEAQAATKRSEALRKKNRGSKRPSGITQSGHPDVVKRRRVLEGCDIRSYLKKQVSTKTGVANTVSLSGLKESDCEQNVALKACGVRNSKDIDHIDIKQLLMDKARKVLNKRLKECSSSKAAKFAAVKEVNGKEKSNDKESKVNCVAVGLGWDRDKSGDKLVTGNEVSSSTSNSVISDDFIYMFHKQSLQQFSIDVPDPDFHDFGRDRMDKCFRDKQIWAAYDDNDGMPRCYAMIRSVVSLTPFKMQIIWLNLETNGKLDLLNHLRSGFSRTFGDFRLGRREISESINCFSHEVKWTKGTCGAIRIFPRKGDVWALYRNWSVEWNELTEDEVIHKYDMVEVLEDYDEQEGVIVIPLVKVAGFKTVFHRHLNLREIRKIPSEEMSRFSHHVPSYVLTGKEGPNAPKGCRELDPAATPSELLQVMMDIKDEFTADGIGEDDENERENN